MSSFHAMWSLGAGVDAAVGYMAVGLDLSLLAHFALIGTVMSVSTIWLANIGWQSETRPRPAGTSASRCLMASCFGVGIIAFCSSLGEGAVADWSAVFLVTVTSATMAQGAIGYAVFLMVMVIMRLLGSGVIAWLGPVSAARLTECSASIGVLLAVLPANSMAALLGFFFLGLGFALIMPVTFSRAANDPDTPPGVAIASVATLGYGGILLGPPLIGFMTHVVTLHYAFGILGRLALLIVFTVPSLEPG